MVRHGGSSAGSYLADPTSPFPSHCVSIVTTSTLRVNIITYAFNCDSPRILIFYANGQYTSLEEFGTPDWAVHMKVFPIVIFIGPLGVIK